MDLTLWREAGAPSLCDALDSAHRDRRSSSSRVDALRELRKAEKALERCTLGEPRFESPSHAVRSSSSEDEESKEAAQESKRETSVQPRWYLAQLAFALSSQTRRALVAVEEKRRRESRSSRFRARALSRRRSGVDGLANTSVSRKRMVVSIRVSRLLIRRRGRVCIFLSFFSRHEKSSRRFMERRTCEKSRRASRPRARDGNVRKKQAWIPPFVALLSARDASAERARFVTAARASREPTPGAAGQRRRETAAQEDGGFSDEGSVGTQQRETSLSDAAFHQTRFLFGISQVLRCEFETSVLGSLSRVRATERGVSREKPQSI